MGLLYVSVFSLFIVLVSSAGLNLEFSWTRINYEWPSNGQRIRRYSQKLPKYGSGGYNQQAETIIFEDPNLEVEHVFGRPHLQTGNHANLQTGNQAGLQTANHGNLQSANYGNPERSIDYQYQNNIPMSANVWRNKVFITVPRRRLGVPSTLNYVSLDNPKRENTPLIPYPSWGKNLYPDPRGTRDNFVSVYRVAIDACDRLWFVDTGIIEIPGNATTVRPPTIVIMDLHTDKVIRTFEIPDDQVRPNSGLASLTIDVTENSCGNAYAYIPDLGGYGLIVYSLRENKSWRITHNYFYLEPLAGEFFISGHNFQWNDGIFSVELTSPKQDGYRDLYFHSMAGTHMFKVSTRILRNETLATRSYHENDFENVGDRGPQSQTSSADIHQASGIMFLGLVNQNAVACWDIHKPLTTISIVQRDDRSMIYPCDVKVRDDKVYVITNAMPEFLYGRLNYDTINFRVWSNTVQGAVQGTMCGGGRGNVKRSGSGGSYY
ncbi:hypothetical protein JTB14_006915 [Gonioctena quinquepunctata]|nr:hypothetical protein JTB14_006915 [Gonioctena quinquepunctata]